MRFYGQYDPPVDQFIFERYFPDLEIAGVYVECGAFDGVTESSCKFFEESMSWRGFNLEPEPRIFDALCRNRPASRNRNVGLSDVSGRRLFKQPVHPVVGRNFGNGSVAHTSEHLADLEAKGCSFEEVEVSVVTWREFVEREDIAHIDLLVLDVEGHELSVIEGMRDAIVLPHVICIEFGHLGLDAVRSALEDLGYVYDISSHGNAFFVKRDVIGLFAFRRGRSACRLSGAERKGGQRRSNRPIAFVHIPKCSGTAFEKYLLEAFAANGLHPRCFTGVSADGGNETLREYVQQNAESPFVFGHVRYAELKSYFPHAFFAVFLRDPVQRTISQYRSWRDPKNFHEKDPHFLVSSDEERRALSFAQRATLEEFVRTDNRIIAGSIGNVQTMMLSTYSGDVMDLHLESAKKNLEGIDFIGITERFLESVAVFRTMFSDAPEYRLAPSSENRSRGELGAVPEHVLEIIREQTAYDRALYEHALQLFQAGHTSVGGRVRSLSAVVGTTSPSGIPQHSDEDERRLGLKAENEFLKRRVEELAALNEQLTRVYEDIVRSRRWRVLQGLQSRIGRFVGR